MFRMLLKKNAAMLSFLDGVLNHRENSNVVNFATKVSYTDAPHLNDKNWTWGISETDLKEFTDYLDSENIKWSVIEYTPPYRHTKTVVFSYKAIQMDSNDEQRYGGTIPL